MSTFMDGPAAGKSVGMTRRAPLYLRVVEDEDGTWDVLDQLDDEPRRTETIWVYQRVGDAVSAFVRPGGRIQIGHYRHVPTMPEDKIRETDDWRAWVEERAGKRIDPGTGIALEPDEQVTPTVE